MVTLTVIIMWSSWRTMSTVVSISMSPDFMELYTIARFIFGSIESDIRKIIPDREKCCIDKIRKEELIEHENNSKWKDQILMTHSICIEPRTFELYIDSSISYKRENIADPKNIALLDHINHYCTQSKKEEEAHEKI